MQYTQALVAQVRALLVTRCDFAPTGCHGNMAFSIASMAEISFKPPRSVAVRFL